MYAGEGLKAIQSTKLTSCNCIPAVLENKLSLGVDS